MERDGGRREMEKRRRWRGRVVDKRREMEKRRNEVEKRQKEMKR